MAETDDLTQRIIELEERINYIEKKFGVSQKAPEILFPKTIKVINAIETEQQQTNGEE